MADINEAIREMVDEAISDKLDDLKLDADNVDGLDDRIDERAKDIVSDELRDHEVMADDVRGLDSAIEDKFNDMINDAVAEHLSDPDNLLDYLAKLKASEAGKRFLHELVREALAPAPA